MKTRQIFIKKPSKRARFQSRLKIQYMLEAIPLGRGGQTATRGGGAKNARQDFFCGIRWPVFYLILTRLNNLMLYITVTLGD